MRRSFINHLRPACCGIAAWILLACSSKPARAEGVWFDEQTFGRFYCRADFQLSKVPKLRELLEQLESDFIQVLHIKPAQDEQIELCLFHNQSSYLKFVKPRVPDAAARRAFFIKGDGPGRVYAQLGNNFEIDIRHEGTHALLHASLPYIPSWLDEGLAEYFQVPAEERVYQNPNLRNLRWNRFGGWKPSLTNLEDKHALSDLGAKEYRESWAWVHFMLHGPPEAGELFRKYLSEIQSGNVPGPLSKHLSKRLPKAQEQLVEHIKTWKR